MIVTAEVSIEMTVTGDCWIWVRVEMIVTNTVVAGTTEVIVTKEALPATVTVSKIVVVCSGSVWVEVIVIKLNSVRMLVGPGTDTKSVGPGTDTKLVGPGTVKVSSIVLGGIVTVLITVATEPLKVTKSVTIAVDAASVNVDTSVTKLIEVGPGVSKVIVGPGTVNVCRIVVLGRVRVLTTVATDPDSVTKSVMTVVEGPRVSVETSVIKLTTVGPGIVNVSKIVVPGRVKVLTTVATDPESVTKSVITVVEGPRVSVETSVIKLTTVGPGVSTTSVTTLTTVGPGTVNVCKIVVPESVKVLTTVATDPDSVTKSVITVVEGPRVMVETSVIKLTTVGPGVCTTLVKVSMMVVPGRVSVLTTVATDPDNVTKSVTIVVDGGKVKVETSVM